MKKILILNLLFIGSLFSQEYYYEKYAPFDENIKSPEEFLGYPIGEMHTRHDLIVSYMEYLSSVSDKAQIFQYGETYEKRKLIILAISSSDKEEVSGDLKEFGVDIDEPDLFNSDIETKNSDDLLGSSEEDQEDDDLEIPAFLRKQKF